MKEGLCWTDRERYKMLRLLDDVEMTSGYFGQNRFWLETGPRSCHRFSQVWEGQNFIFRSLSSLDKGLRKKI